MLNNLKISQKIYFLGSIQLLLMLIMGLTSINQMAKIGVELVEIAEDDIPLTRHITKVTEYQLQQAVYFEKALVRAALAYSGDTDAQAELPEIVKRVKTYRDKTSQELEETKRFVAKVSSQLHSEEVIAEFAKVGRELEKIGANYQELSKQIDDVFSLLEQSRFEDVMQTARSVEDLEEKMDVVLVALLEEVQNFTLNAAIKAEGDEKLGIALMWSIFSLTLVLGVVLPYFVARTISVPINNLKSRLGEVADGDGDLTVRLDDECKDETGDVARAFNKFMGVLRDLISGTSKQADSLGDSAEIALNIMQSTLKNVEQQRVETEAVAAAVTQMTATTQDVAKSAAKASTVTSSVSNSVNEGRRGALETQQIIQQLNDEVSEASDVIRNLVTETNKIGSVLESIQGIAEQTNLLALNAAIEAARAGESGRGFAVVADEVRSLAQRTQTSTVDIQDLIERLQTEAQNAVASMEKGSESASVCLQRATQTAETFKKAETAVGEIADINTQIAAAAEQQSAVACEIDRNLNNIKEIAMSTSSGAQQTAKANETIAKSLISLHTSLNAFQT